MGRRPHIQFTINPEQKDEIEHYARVKGFDTGSNLSRVAVFAYMRRTPLKEEEKITGTIIDNDIS